MSDTNHLIINTRPRFYSMKTIKKVEEIKKAKYVCEVAASSGANMPAVLFYTEEAHPVSGSRYFIFYDSGDGFYVANGQSQTEKTYSGIIDMDEVFYSVHRHDCYQTPSGYMVDGGDAYFRVIGNKEGLPETARMKIIDGEMRVCEGIKNGE